MKRVKTLLKGAGTSLIGIIATVVVTRAITGEPLAGLTKLTGLYRTLAQGSVAAWAFALTFLAALCGIYYASRHLPARFSKGRVHFVPDAHNSGWARHSDTQIDLRIGGVFTYEGVGSVTLLKAFLRGTQPVTDMAAQILGWDARPIMVSRLHLQDGLPQPAVIQVYLAPVVGTRGEPLCGPLVLLDIYNRKFVVGPVEFPYLGTR